MFFSERVIFTFFFLFPSMLADHFEWEGGLLFSFVLVLFLSLAVPLCLPLSLMDHCFVFREGVCGSVKSVPQSPPDVPLANFLKGISYLPFLPSASRLRGICKAKRLCFFPCHFPNVHNCSVSDL